MRVPLVVATLTVAAMAVPGVSAQETAYHYLVEDAEFDEADSCTPWWDANLNGACDLLQFEAGNDDENLYLRFTMGAVSPNPQAGVALRASLTGAGETKMVQVMLWNGGTEEHDGCSDTGPLPEGISHTRDGSSALVTVPLASFDAVPGGQLELGSLEVRQLVRDPRPDSVMLCEVVDAAPADGPIQLLGGAPEGLPPVFENITTPAADIGLSFANATTGTYVYNWTHNLTGLDLMVGGDAVAGNVSLSILAANETLYNASITDALGDNATLHSFQNATAGDWQVVLEVTEFQGNVTLRLGAPAAPDLPATGNATGNATDNQTVDPDDAEAPGWPMLPLLATLAVLARRRQR